MSSNLTAANPLATPASASGPALPGEHFGGHFGLLALSRLLPSFRKHARRRRMLNGHSSEPGHQLSNTRPRDSETSEISTTEFAASGL